LVVVNNDNNGADEDLQSEANEDLPHDQDFGSLMFTPK
jgi:hypothetical protein